MKAADYTRLVLLAAIWGASFIFMRVAAPALGPILTAHARLLLGGLALLAWFLFTGFDARFGQFWRQYLVIGAVNCAIPLSLYAFAAIHAPGSLLSIVNATSPMFGLVLGALFLGERVRTSKIIGLVLGTAGVALIAQRGEMPVSVEGFGNAEWVLADYGDYLIHVFSEKARAYYDLDRLWRHARMVPIPEASEPR